MLYGILTSNYTKGTTDMLLFKQKSIANMCKKVLNNLWNSHTSILEYQMVYDEVYSIIEEINRKEWEEVNKNVVFSINEKGFVHNTTSNIRIVNLDNPIFVP